jgi:hypothetical protein
MTSGLIRFITYNFSSLDSLIVTCLRDVLGSLVQRFGFESYRRHREN